MAIRAQTIERLSIFDIYKIGVGPSSSHTLGPWKAATDFVKSLQGQPVDKLKIHLYGSLSKTGKGHATDIAILLGLEGHQPETINQSTINESIFRIKGNQAISINQKMIEFKTEEQLIFHAHSLPNHPNTVTFQAFSQEQIILEATYYSVGGGFIEKEGAQQLDKKSIVLPYPIDKGFELLHYTEMTNSPISNIVLQNELVFGNKSSVEKRIEHLFFTMLDCVYQGCYIEGILPGGLNVKRRAKKIAQSLLPNEYKTPTKWIDAIKNSTKEFGNINKWVSCFALAVNEQNAAMGRIVTAPTNGAAGVIPAVLFYYYCFCENKGMEDIQRFILTSGEIGCLFKKGATISAAVGGCQAEIGVSSAMAAGGLTEVLGGSPAQVLMAAEIAMEHHLGLTCDPIGGLVQIPCIERNTMGAIKAITASNLALSSNPEDAIVNFDTVVKTMWDTAIEMNDKYKETSEGGLAINLPVILPEC